MADQAMTILSFFRLCDGGFATAACAGGCGSFPLSQPEFLSPPHSCSPRSELVFERAMPSPSANQKPLPRDGKRIAFLAFPPVRELDLVGPLDVFATANRVAKRDLYDVVILGSDHKQTVAGMSGLHFTSSGSYQKFTKQIDTLLVPGGLGCETVDPPKSLLKWLIKAEQRVRRIGSICTGAFLLAKAGILHERKATTHWAFSRQLEQEFPSVKVDPTPIWIQDGKIYTSAGVTAGIDLSLAMIEEDYGASLALEVARNLVVFLRRPGSQSQFSTTLGGQVGEKNPFKELLVWIADNVGADLGVETLAARVSMSPRNFHRVFTATTGKSPARFVEEVRVETARRQLEKSNRTVDDIAVSCGFGTADSMRRSFLRHLESTPGQYRRNFRSSRIDRKLSENAG